MLVICLIVVIYMIITFVTLDERCSETVWRDLKDNNVTREATTKDVWLSLIWPVFWLYILCKAIIWMSNDTLVIILLLVGFKYKRTNMYRWIDEKVKFM